MKQKFNILDLYWYRLENRNGVPFVALCHKNKDEFKNCHTGELVKEEQIESPFVSRCDDCIDHYKFYIPDLFVGLDSGKEHFVEVKGLSNFSRQKDSAASLRLRAMFQPFEVESGFVVVSGKKGRNEWGMRQFSYRVCVANNAKKGDKIKLHVPEVRLSEDSLSNIELATNNNAFAIDIMCAEQAKSANKKTQVVEQISR